MGGKKSGKLAGILIVMAIVIFGLVYGGITLTKKGEKVKKLYLKKMQLIS